MIALSVRDDCHRCEGLYDLVTLTYLLNLTSYNVKKAHGFKTYVIC